MDGSLLEQPRVTSTWLRLLGRLKPGVPLEQAGPRLNALAGTPATEWRLTQQVHAPVRGRAARRQLGGGGTLGSSTAVLAAAVHPARRRRSRAAHRLRERRPAPAGALGDAAIGVRAAARARRGTRPRDAPGARRGPGAHGDRRGSRRRARVLGRGRARGLRVSRAKRGRPRSVAGPACAGVHRRRLHRGGPAVRERAGDSCLARGPIAPRRAGSRSRRGTAAASAGPAGRSSSRRWRCRWCCWSAPASSCGPCRT